MITFPEITNLCLNVVLLLCMNTKAKIVLTTQNKFLRSSVNVERTDCYRDKNPFLSEKTQVPGSCSATGLLEPLTQHGPDLKIIFPLRSERNNNVFQLSALLSLEEDSRVKVLPDSRNICHKAPCPCKDTRLSCVLSLGLTTRLITEDSAYIERCTEPTHAACWHQAQAQPVSWMSWTFQHVKLI